jgi:hypothetical protein
MSAAPDIRAKRPRDPKANARQAKRRERTRMEKRGIRYVDDVPMMREIIGAAVALGMMHRAAVDDDSRAAHDIASLIDRVVTLAYKWESVAKALKAPGV